MRRMMMIAALGLVVSACAGGAAESTAEFTGEFSEVSAGLDGGDVDNAGAPEATTAGDEGGAERGMFAQLEPASADRKVIRNARLELRTDDTRSAFDRIVAVTESAGGFVASATVFPVENEEDQPEVAMVLRVPADRLSEVMGEIKGSVEEVVSQSQDAADVTEQFIDLEARLTNLRALETELRALLEEVRQQPDADPEKLLRVFQELSSVRGEIEQIQGQLNYLDDAVTLATLEVRLTPTPAALPIVEDTWRPLEVARDALRSLVGGLQDVADAVIAFALFALPMLLITVGIPLGILYTIYRAWRKRRPPVTPTATPKPEPGA